MQKISQNEEIKNMSELKPRITENGIDYIYGFTILDNSSLSF